MDWLSLIRAVHPVYSMPSHSLLLATADRCRLTLLQSLVFHVQKHRQSGFGVSCTRRVPCPHGGPLLTWASAGDTQTLKGRAGSVSCGLPGSCCIRGFVWTLQASLAGMGFDSKCDFAPLTVLLGLLLCSWMWGIFFWWDPTFSSR